MGRISVIVNARSGAGIDSAVQERIRKLFDAAGAPADIVLARDGGEIAAHAERAVAQGATIIVAAGGDGTVNAVASVVAGSEAVLGILPLGTLNHFAKDLEVPPGLEDAVRHIVAGKIERVDVGDVNGRVFVNNSSLGLYPDLVRRREHLQRLGLGKWFAFASALFSVFKRYPFFTIRISVGGHDHVRRTPFVFIGNNEYETSGLAIGSRLCLTNGRLCLYVARHPGRLRLVQLAVRALVGRLRQVRDFDVMVGTEITVSSRHRHLPVATDGETLPMAPPLHYRIRPAALRVIGGRQSSRL